MSRRSAIWQMMMYTLAAISLLVALGDYLLGVPVFGGLFLSIGVALLPFIAWSTRRHRRAAAPFDARSAADTARLLTGGSQAA